MLGLSSSPPGGHPAAAPLAGAHPWSPPAAGAAGQSCPPPGPASLPAAPAPPRLGDEPRGRRVSPPLSLSGTTVPLRSAVAARLSPQPVMVTDGSALRAGSAAPCHRQLNRWPWGGPEGQRASSPGTRRGHARPARAPCARHAAGSPRGPGSTRAPVTHGSPRGAADGREPPQRGGQEVATGAGGGPKAPRRVPGILRPAR